MAAWTCMGPWFASSKTLTIADVRPGSGKLFTVQDPHGDSRGLRSEVCLEGLRRGSRVSAKALVSVEVSETEGIWQDVRLLQRQKDLAVKEEDFSKAAELRDLLQRTIKGLPPIHQYTIQEVDNLQGCDKSAVLKSISKLGAAGCGFAVPDLAALLHDVELQESAELALFQIFMKCRTKKSMELMEKGEHLIAQGTTLDEALENFNELIEQEPSYAEAFSKRATVLYFMQRYEESIADCRVVTQMQPYHFPAYSGMGLCYFHLKEYRKAVHAFEEALKIHPGLKHIRRLSEQLKQDQHDW